MVRNAAWKMETVDDKVALAHDYAHAALRRRVPTKQEAKLEPGEQTSVAEAEPRGAALTGPAARHA